MSNIKSKGRLAFEAAVVGIETGAVIAAGAALIEVAPAILLSASAAFGISAALASAQTKYAPRPFYIPGGRKVLKNK